MNRYRDATAAVLFAAAWCDGDISDFEKQALDRVLQKLGFSRAEIMQMIAAALEGPSQDAIEIPDEPELGPQVMRYALAVGLADGQLSENEVGFLAKLAGHLRLSSAALDALKAEAEGLVADHADTPQGSDRFDRVEALLPDAKVQLADQAVEHTPPVRARPEDAAAQGQLTEEKLLYRGEKFGDELEL